ncbi:MAG TPA: hypothetical protein VLY04_23370 [Bryobacteraceae bacterium]|nr:hypothetical protein [Bryobacteraceae bacterium]
MQDSSATNERRTLLVSDPAQADFEPLLDEEEPERVEARTPELTYQVETPAISKPGKAKAAAANTPGSEYWLP